MQVALPRASARERAGARTRLGGAGSRRLAAVILDRGWLSRASCDTQAAAVVLRPCGFFDQRLRQLPKVHFPQTGG